MYTLSVMKYEAFYIIYFTGSAKSKATTYTDEDEDDFNSEEDDEDSSKERKKKNSNVAMPGMYIYYYLLIIKLNSVMFNRTNPKSIPTEQIIIFINQYIKNVIYFQFYMP